ncbi:PREDICTED: uncharacterized protein LOC106805137 [Priapulus caudatus]|uniref:Uncharacterized protein LOC106805137 n=1 Tax=Priapulus caudatus TaxID=37621 RepID=A0ABM1DQ87_PRICU|nr:PREDICTED: uncharacterized protein LOC106805137 [Priapulus caudatus]
MRIDWLTRKRTCVQVTAGALFVLLLLLVGLVQLQLAPGNWKEDFYLEVAVLAYDRPASLRRLLASLEEAAYDNERITLHICIDRPKAEDKLAGHREAVQVAERFQFTHGEKVLTVRPRNVGVTAQWLDCWNPDVSPGNYGLILEDDMRLSPYYYRWLKAACITYGGYSDGGNIVLSRPRAALPITQVWRDPLCTVCENLTAFLYRIPRLWAYAPMPNHWRQFRDWVLPLLSINLTTDSEFIPYVPDQNVVMNRWLTNGILHGHVDIEFYMYYYQATRKTFSLYAYLPQNKSFACNHRELGVNVKPATFVGKCDSEPLTMWDDEYIRFPANPVRLDLDGNPVD